jgi:hypothetical protein
MGYVLAGYWLILPVFGLMVLLWFPANKRSPFLSVSVFLSVFVILAAVGITLSVPANLMIIACTAALVSWDLLLFGQSASEDTPSKADSLLEKYHLQALALTASAGLVIALIIRYIHLQLSFTITALLSLAAVGCLTYGLRYIINKLD